MGQKLNVTFIYKHIIAFRQVAFVDVDINKYAMFYHQVNSLLYNVQILVRLH